MEQQVPAGVAGVVGGRAEDLAWDGAAGCGPGGWAAAGCGRGGWAAAGCELETEACCRAELLSSGVGIFLQWAQPVRHVKLDGDGDQADF
jgi:hypothetical protein